MPNIENPEKEKDSLNSLNYNDRLDGYGFGESESQDADQDYERDPHFTHHCIDLGEGYRKHKNEPFTKDESGLRNQYGPVDQYSFRDVYLPDRTEKIHPWIRIKNYLTRKK
ncbi:hypothetical protein [Peredibacter starrii]|uniref:Uncharacterized protein n=1 Tax=Peredibacter starrii TaxID=28202 RepID=A0AAX4HSG8_9BACT|nr:hypothetical protein [Peredibacter starrii]WPU66161.1 hypothetical protein SOO65_05320 [Peredibacter starrii]